MLLPFFLISCSGLNGNSFKNAQGIMPGGLQSARILQKVPFYPQGDHQCGPASMAEVLNYFGAKTTPEGVASSIYSKTARGTLGIDMLIYPAHAGFKASQYSGGQRDIVSKIDRGLPLIVFVDYGFWVYQRGHFMVVVGYDANGPVVHSGDEPFEHIPWEEFMAPWKRTGYWTLLITPGKQKNGKDEK